MTPDLSRAEAEPATVEIRVYNTLSRRKEPLRTIEPGKVRMYVCGVTPYDSAHVGHGMSLMSFDVIRRYLEHRGYEVRHIQNFTDIDDKIINRANAERIDPDALTERFIEEWHAQMRALNVLPATHYPRATEEVGPIIAMVQGLIDRDYAYAVDGDVYFRVRSFAGYGKLSHRDLDDLLSGARVEVDERKEDPLDFALWKAAKPGEPSWESPWGPGRPGWHIECSAMSSTYLGGQIDIHGGGADLIFPHHENEIAQSEAFLGVEPFARYWVHNGLMRVGAEKMSKSLGNFVRLKEIVDRGLGPAFRLMVLQSHYRAPLTYSEEGLQAAERGLSRLRASASPISIVEDPGPSDPDFRLESMLGEVDNRFHAAMDDDFNAPEAVAVLFDLSRAINRARASGHNSQEIRIGRDKLVRIASVLGLDLELTETEKDKFARVLGFSGFAEMQAVNKTFVQMRNEIAHSGGQMAQLPKELLEPLHRATQIFIELQRPTQELAKAHEALKQPLENVARLQTELLKLQKDSPEAAVMVGGLLTDQWVEIRSILRESKNWQAADQIRNELAKLGVTIEDTPAGATWTQRRG
jgi:cysteinyl-tRNA synthetase